MGVSVKGLGRMIIYLNNQSIEEVGAGESGSFGEVVMGLYKEICCLAHLLL